jgi:hypothetical protein
MKNCHLIDTNNNWCFLVVEVRLFTGTSSFFGIGILPVSDLRFNWAVGISVGITSLAGTHFFRKRGAGCIK